MEAEQQLLVFTSKEDVRNWVRKQKKSGKRVALVPTMVRVCACVRSGGAGPTGAAKLHGTLPITTRKPAACPHRGAEHDAA